MTNNTRCVVYSTDASPIDQLHISWSIRSLLKYATSKFDLVVLADKPVKSLDFVGGELGDRGSFRFVHCASDLLKSAGLDRSVWHKSWPFSALYRLAVPLDSSFSGYDSILYLDTDTLVLSSAIDLLLSMPVGPYEVAGAPDVVLDQQFRVRHLAETDFKQFFGEHKYLLTDQSLFTRAYINSGMLLMNLVAIRCNIPWYIERIKVFADVLRNNGCCFIDQDFINACMSVSPHISRLFNWFISGGGDTDNCVVHHYCGHSYDRMRDRALSENLF